MGDWKDYDRAFVTGTKQDLLVFGAAADYTEAGDTAGLTHVADVFCGHANGLGFYAAYLGRYARHNTVGTPGTNGGSTGIVPLADTYDWTVRAQASYAIDQHWEPYVRYELIHFDAAGLAGGTANEVHEITVGTNYFIFVPQAKFTVDLMYLPNGSPVHDDSSGVLSDNGHNEVVLRAQFQLLL